MLDVKFKLLPGHTSERRWTSATTLDTLFWNVTYACNYRCDICFLDAGRADPDELSTREACEVLRHARDVGVRDIIISGGEPFMRPDLIQILSEMAGMGITARIASNGSLITERTLKELRKKTLVKSFQISLDTLDPDLYARMHGCEPDAFQKAYDAVRRIRDHGFHTTVSVRLTKDTLPGIPGLLECAGREGWATVTVHCPVHSRRTVGAPPQDADVLSLLSPAVEAFTALPRHWLIETYIPWAPFHPAVKRWAMHVRVVHRGCAAGRNRLAIHPAGAVSPCVCLDVPEAYIGNVRTDRLDELFARSPICEMFRRPKEHGICTSCPLMPACGGGCRAAALSLTGRIDGQDMSCPVWQSRLRGERGAGSAATSGRSLAPGSPLHLAGGT